MNLYTSGSMVRSSAAFVNTAGVPTNPTTITFKYRAGAGSVNTIVGPTNDGPGAYHYDIDTTGWAGPDTQLVTCQWQGTGAVVAIDDDYFGVTAPAL
jgi:hypothetical protein